MLSKVIDVQRVTMVDPVYTVTDVEYACLLNLPLLKSLGKLKELPHRPWGYAKRRHICAPGFRHLEWEVCRSGRAQKTCWGSVTMGAANVNDER